MSVSKIIFYVIFTIRTKLLLSMNSLPKRSYVLSTRNMMVNSFVSITSNKLFNDLHIVGRFNYRKESSVEFSRIFTYRLTITRNIYL